MNKILPGSKICIIKLVKPSESPLNNSWNTAKDSKVYGLLGCNRKLITVKSKEP